ncbi:MAG: LysM peptidoglycan-binding domain-containing protein [Mesorhizobium sp.]|uniref:LysM peptidoglycan-binding domain-containing protein n=1 Tax=Mesorhizobium sp. TaxID=1871066 RepID=UPI000FE53C92|nr:LysM peptidoglycan-binding domain-containing protein [Mesorhizobium sp.]RWM99687.1 MAG: LysM peptidoglycan-binding domain-containing protein [Mesorhizobium sp.]
MIRPINTVKPPPPPRVDPKAQAEQTTRLQAEATKLQNEIRLANRMGEVDAAAGARQRLTQVNAELTTAQPTAPAQPGPELPAAVTVANGNGGATAAPALFTVQDLGGGVVPPEVKALEVKTPDVKASEVKVKANDILKAIDGGKSIDNIAAEQGLAPEDVVAALNAGGMTAVATEHANGDTRTVVITAGDRTITENQDYQHGGYYTQETGPDMQATSSPIRDDLGRKETTSVDAQTGAITTTLVDDLGDGAVTERTTNPQTRETTTTETSGNGAVTATSNLPNGSTVQTVTPAGGPALPVTTVTAPDGEVTTLAQSQTADGSGVPAIEEQLAAGKSIAEIAEASNLTPEQVIAEMNAAGLEVTQGGDPGETLQIVVTDPNTGRTATYNNDYQHGSRSSTTTEGSTETTNMVDGNGVTTQTERNTETGEQTTTIVDPVNNTETKIVVDKDGRRTETVVETLNDAEPIDYEVKPGDNLSDIAEANGVTLDDLAVSNPDLFTTPRDPDLIHPGETVVIDGATRTTVNVTFNGYTMTTSLDGKVTLTNAATGAVTDIAAGTAQQALAELLLDINPNSSDPQQAKEDQIVKTALDGMFGGATPELTADALEKQQAVVAAMEAYGAPVPATPQLEGTPTSVGPFGDPPSATAPSGGKWVPLMVDGNWQWYDPEVAKAIAAENVAVSRLGEAQANSVQSQAQLDVYALDPAYKEAMEAAEAALDDTLAPYGLELKPTEPKGTLAEAQERLSLANSALEDAATATAEYQAGEQSLLDAIAKQVDLPAISDPNRDSASSPGGPSAEEANQDVKAEHAEVAQLLIDSALHTANGNKATVDQLVASTELELKLTDAKPGPPQYTAIEERLKGLQALQGGAANQVTLAEAYQQYGIAQKAAADLAVKMEPLKQQLLAQARERNPHHFDWKGFTNGHGDFTGKILSQDIVEENGQLYVVTVYENATFNDENGDDTNVHKSALTYDLNDDGIRQDFRDDPLNKQWQEMLASTDTSSAPVCTVNANGSQSALDAARSKIVEVQVNNFDAALKDAKTALVDATAARDQAITDHGPGTVEAPAGTLKPGETAVKVTVSGRDMWVAPEVAAAYEAQGPGAIGESGKSVQIEMNGQKLWVSPEVAAAEINRDQAETQKDRLEDWEQNVRPAMVAGRDWYAFSASQPKLLEYGSGEHEAKLKNQYFEERQGQAMAGYQVRFDNYYESGLTGEYKPYAPGELSGTVAQTLGLEPSSEGVEKVVDEIADRAGDNAEVKIVPIFSLDGGMESSTALFAIKSGGNEAGYVDSAGKYYSSFDEFQHENRLFSDKGNLVMAKGGDMSLGKDGFSLDELEVADARKVDFWDKASDIGLGLLAGAATIVSFVPGGQWAIPIAVGAGSILGGKALYKEADHLLQGGDFDSQSAWNVATGVTAFLPVGAGALRTYGLAKAGLSLPKASAGGFGLTRTNDVSAFMQSGNKLANAAWGLDAAAVVTGAPLLGKSVEDLVAHGGDMDLLEFANAIVGIGVGTVGTGLGGRSLLYNMPGGAGGTRSGTHTSASFPGAAESGPQPRAVYEMGPDGVYKPTGEQVMPDPNEIIIDGDVVGETSDQQGPGFGGRNGFDNTGAANRPTGPRALPAGESDGPNPPPPAGGKGDPSGDGQSSRPMVVHEQGPDGVYRATDELAFHDADHPVIPGEVTRTSHASGEPPAMVTGRHPDGSTGRNTTRPADSDPIVVPNEPTATDGPMRLVWDPETRSFTGMPEPDTSGYIYSSGKDPETPSAYLDGLTSEQLLARYEAEKSYYSSRELAERYGPDGVQIPRTPLRDILPDFRIGVSIRTRLNTGEYFDIGSPTVAAAGVGIGTKTDFGMIGWSVVDSISQRSMTPLKDALYTHGVVSYRAREYRNITGLQAGVWPVSNQTALPVRGSDLSAAASKAIFSDATGYNARPLDAAIVGMTPDGEGIAIEMTYTPSLEGKDATLVAGQHDFFGVPAENSTGHVELEGALPFDRVMTEFKAGLRLPIVANHVGPVEQMPRLGFEKRPELPVKDTLQPGDVVSRQTYDQIQSALGSTNLKIQFAVKDPAKASELIAAIGQGDGIASIRDLVKSGQIDPSNTVSFIDEPTLSGLRLSAVPGKAPIADIVLLTGEKARVANPEAMLIDVIFNDQNRLPGVLGLNPDRMATSAAYKVKSAVQSWLPARFTPDGTPQSRYMPSAGNIYRNLYGADGTPATRYTLSLSTPPLPAGAVAFSAEVRIQYKSNAAKVAPSIAKGETATLAFDRADGRNETLTVPAWLARAVETSRDGAATGIPKGGKASLDQFLSELGTTARPDQRAAIEQFRTEFGPSIVDGGFMRQNVADGVLTFLSSQVGSRRSGPMQLRDENGQSVTATRYGPPPKSAENVYVPPADGPSARGDEPELMHKSHILFRDPETGEPYILPWTRGASDDHVPGSLGHPEDGNLPVEGAGDPARPLRGNVGPYVFRADTRAPSQIRDAGGFSPPPPTGIWVDNPQGIVLSNYVLGNTHGRFVGTSQSVSGAKTFVAEESRAARQQGYTYLYTLNPSSPRLHVPTEFEAMGRPVSESMARVDETAIDGSIPWSEVHGWRMMDPDGNFVGEFTRNEDAVAPGGSTQKRPQVILRPADEFWDAPAPAEALPPPVAEVVGNETPAVTGEKPPTENSAAETPAATWPPAPDRGRVVFDPASEMIISLELPVRSAAEPGFAEPVRAPTGPEVRALAADQTSELTGTQLHAIKPEHIAKLAPEQVAALSPEQVGQLTFDQLAALRPTQLRALGGEQLQAIRPSKLQAVAPGRITGLRPDQVAALSQEQLAGLTIEQVRKLTPDQIARLSDEQRNGLTPEQVAAMRPAQFSHLNATQFAALDPALVAARNPATMAKLSPRHVAALTREQLDALTIHQIEVLTKQQIAALTPKQLGELSPGQLRKFTPRQFTWMSTEQTNALSVLQMNTYRATHKKVMTPDQTAAVDQALSHARFKENAQLVATFGPMAGSSYAVWQILPPHWAATAAGVALGVRGIVFSAQSAFPTATANHKPLGRALNAASGASFIFSSPGSAAGLLRGDNVGVNGSFSLGNVVYGTKSALQSITGRPVLRNVAEHLAGPGYVFGSLLYTAQNLHSPLAATAGVLFTVGSAEFWVSAARTDLLNRRAVPRTPEQIDARAKSDARWTMADRISLGVTFGVGMLLFAWDALDDQPWNNTGKTPPTDPTAPGDAPSGVDGAPPDDTEQPEPEPGTQTPPQDFPQLAVLADDGLNMRTQPDGDSTVETVLQPGSFIEQTAGPSADQSGDAWIPVEGFGPDGEMHSGWVSGDHVEAHADGSSNPAGRTNPTLEKDGYQWVEVKNGDSIRLIARTHSADVAETVVLNMDHILSPDVIFSGDRIYLPATLVG